MTGDMIERLRIAGDTGTGMRSNGCVFGICHEAADRIAALEAEASEGERLRAAIREALDCFEAAAAEGMADRVAEAREADGFDPASVAGLFERRVAFAIPALERALIPEAPVRDGWLPIETAPKDGTYIMVAEADGRVTIACWIERNESWWELNNDSTDAWGMALNAIHWRPLPAPPQDNREG